MTPRERGIGSLLARPVTRREFIARAGAIGLSASTLGAILAACGRRGERSEAVNHGAPISTAPPGPSGRSGGSEIPVILPAPKSAEYGRMVEAAELVSVSALPDNLRDRLREIASDLGVPLSFALASSRPQAPLEIAIDATDIQPQGYRLKITARDHDSLVSIEASDEAGAFYGLLSMAQLIVAADEAIRVRLATVEDHPSFARRGAIFDTIQLPTGRSAALEETRLLERVRFGVAYKMNLVYHPSHSPAHSQPWPELVAYCDSHYVQLVSSIGYRDDLSLIPRAEVKAYLKSLFDLGIRSFTLNWDDIPVDEPEALSRDHAEIFNDLYGYLRSLDDEVRVAITMPPYGGVPFRNLLAGHGQNAETYLDRMRVALPEDVAVFWTGDGGVFSPTVTRDGAAAYGSLVGHELMLWDNDALEFSSQRRPLSGRATDLPEVISTYMGNLAPPQSAWVGTNGHFALLTMLLYAWDPEGYDPVTAATIAGRLLDERD